MRLNFVNRVFLPFLIAVSTMGSSDFPFKILKNSFEEKNLTWREIKVKDFKDAKKIMKEKEELVFGQLEPTYDPYRGTDSIPEVCLSKNLPKVQNRDIPGGFFKLISIHASKNKIIADCSDDKKLLKTQYLLLYCEKGKSIFLIKYFYSNDLDWELGPAAECL